MARRFFVSFASSNLAHSRRRIRAQAKALEFFDDCFAFSEHDLSRSFRVRFSEHLTYGVRGFGYWCWKPQIVYQLLQKLSEGDQLIWVDSGCHLNPQGLKRLSEYFDTLSTENPITGFRNFPSVDASGNRNRFHGSLPISTWTKGDLIDFFGARKNASLLASDQYAGGIFLLQKEEQSTAFLSDWLNPFHQNWCLVDDSPSRSPNEPGFKEHRHDQSVFSFLAYDYQINTLPAAEFYSVSPETGNVDWAALEHFPIHARRDRGVTKFPLVHSMSARAATVLGLTAQSDKFSD